MFYYSCIKCCHKRYYDLQDLQLHTLFPSQIENKLKKERNRRPKITINVNFSDMHYIYVIANIF